MSKESAKHKDKVQDISQENIQKGKRHLLALLVDNALDYHQSQEELMAVAMALKDKGISPCIICLKKSMLAKIAKEKSLSSIEFSSNTGLIIKLLWFYKRSMPLLVHVFSLSMLLTINRFIKLRLKDSTVFIHSCFTLPNQLHQAMTSHIMRVWEQVDKVIFPSHDIANTWIDMGLDATKTQCIYTALDKKEVKIISQNSAKRRHIFAVMADASLDSGLNTVLEAMQLVLNYKAPKSCPCPPFEVRVFSKRGDYNDFIQKAQELKVEHCLSLLSEQILADTFCHVHSLILPHLKTETNLTPLMLAFASHIPVVATKIPTYTEIMQDKMLFVEPSNAKELSKVMIKLMSDPFTWQEQAKKSAHMRTFALMPRLQNDYILTYTGLMHKKDMEV